MKLRESGMPPEAFWETLFDVPAILDAFGFDAHTNDVAELGCGYGTFTVPLAARITGTVHALDIDPAMVERTDARAHAAGLDNVRAEVRDVLANGFVGSAWDCDAVLLFNILHGEEPMALLRAARDAVRPGGIIAVIHWRTDIDTPRGPPADIRPTADQVAAWAASVENLVPAGPSFLLPPWHYGLKLERTDRVGP